MNFDDDRNFEFRLKLGQLFFGIKRKLFSKQLKNKKTQCCAVLFIFESRNMKLYNFTNFTIWYAALRKYLTYCYYYIFLKNIVIYKKNFCY